MIPDPIKKVEDFAKDTNTYMEKRTRGVLRRYPLLFTFLVVFGVVAVVHGFEAVIAYIPFFNEHPAVVFAIGVVVLTFTGSLYKRLDRKIE
jgi:fumarate reductase subunit C